MTFKKSVQIYVLTAIFSSAVFGQAKLQVNQQRLESRILKLSEFGRDSEGRGQRIAFSKGDIEARNWLIELLKKADLEVKIDSAGNIIGRRAGKNPALKPIAFGSHIDMVPDGGNYDGCLGSMAALEIIEVLNENKIITEHPLEVIIFPDEEGSTVGSMAMAGIYNLEGLNKLSQSKLTIAEGITAIGGNPNKLQESARKKGDLKAFLELHIEQGGILENEKIQIGVVEGIVGIVSWDVTVEGFANHAGTTPMNMRQDALLAAAKLIVAVNEVITKTQGRQVGTIGKISAMPGAYNVIPGKVTMGLQIRDLDYEKIWRLFREIEERAVAIETSSKTKISFILRSNPSKPALTDKSLQKQIVASAQKLGLSYKIMPSGAGHDSQEIAEIAPIAMIFVPSVGGISHSPKEFTKAYDMANGANVLLHTILALDK